MPPPEPDPRPPPPPPPEPAPAPAGAVPGLGPRIFVVRRAAPQIPLRPQLAPPIPRLQPPVARPPLPQPIQPQPPMDILQEILRQQQVLRIQQEAMQNMQVPIPAAAAAAVDDDDDVSLEALQAEEVSENAHSLGKQSSKRQASSRSSTRRGTKKKK